LTVFTTSIKLPDHARRVLHREEIVVTIEEQEELGVRRPSSRTYVTPYSRSEITPSEREIMGQAVSAAGQMMSHRQMTHLARSEENPIQNAVASLIYSAAYGFAGALITGGLLVLLFIAFGGNEEVYLILFFIFWGICWMAAFYLNRKQGLYHSPSGLEHAEIQSRERIAKFVVKEYIGLLEKKWRLD
jgi:hypothetical protein